MLEFFVSLYKSLPFARAMAAREMKMATKGSVIGFGWIVVRPFIQLAAYIFIVTYVFGSRLGPSAGAFDYALYALSGMFGWQILQRGLEESSSLIRDRTEILKQVIYPIETLPITTFLAAAIGPFVILLVYVVLAAVSGNLNWTILLLPLPLIILLLLVLGLSWTFMVIGVILKDLREIISISLGLMVYFTPVLLGPTMVPVRIWRLILLNPLSHVVISFRDIFDSSFHPISWLIFGGTSAAALLIGIAVIIRAKVTINEYM